MKILLAFLLLLAQPAFADEYYEFYRIHCIRQIPAFEIEHVPYWNIRHVVWPGKSEWQEHIRSLKTLEKEQDLYVFDQWYGYYDKTQLEFTCGPFRVSIRYDKLFREEGPVGSKAPVRMNSRVTIESADKTLVSAIPLRAVERLRVYADYERAQYVDVCTQAGCGDGLFSSIGTLDSGNLEKVIKK
jgi:hypothetical protein